jgi:hypothetical protein
MLSRGFEQQRTASPDEYFQQTEYAVRLAYNGLSECLDHAHQAMRLMPPPIERDGMRVLLPDETPEAQKRSARASELLRRYGELGPSQAMLAGSIVQAAHMAIALFSNNASIPSKYQPLVKDQSAIRFCVGEECYGVPTGLIVLAARNQFCHWNDDQVHRQTKTVFEALADAFMDDPLADLAFDLTSPTIAIYAAQMLFTALGWNTYEKYLAAMTRLVKSASQTA